MNKFCQQCSETDQQQTSKVCRGDTIPFVREDDLLDTQVQKESNMQCQK